ncbi:Uncharacterized conserved protein YbaP, TraB family [Lutibacter oricola]|uniref:Uncharacterized conserved protein YbaP, TraB family n=1 Tax=Lutibacter oricola TaxID=762486 RepID=A0A1H2RV79_9FLAO|nr:TraB/GumN family protein [Lutibacter oricola]SDW23382.1 Uncharacterized conserved protein YbaP, TraB family [Lutibacter oricola]
MKKIFLFLLLFCAIIAQAQKENSLLWKISGNGLEKESYLFGTMHVSQKIAFNLDDIFFESLQKADFVALESDPNEWLEYAFNMREMTLALSYNNLYGNSSFYNKAFELKQPKKEQLVFFISQENQLINNVLYRTNTAMQDFQEDTYLDMFIYQAGKKFNKKIFSLEDVERSTYLVERASINANKEKPDVWLQKKLKDDYYMNLLNNTYREKNISLLDSINKGMFTKHHMKYMLYLRNEEMAANMDTIMKKGSLFAGIGAAHLAGDEGVLNLLKEKGYTLTPLLSKKTKKGESIKNKIDEKFINTPYQPQTSSDGFFTVNLPHKLFELNFMNSQVYLCPDLTNGSYINISRISTFNALNKEKLTLNEIDKLLFENIPGKIIEKTKISKSGFEGFNIVNKTKTGNYQRYQIFVTPIEVIIFKMGGKKDFVKKEGEKLFSTIKFNNIGNEFVSVAPKLGGFTVEVPKFNKFSNKNSVGERLIEAMGTNNYYFVKEVILNDINYIEEDDFELERIHERFYKNIDLKYNGGKFQNSTTKTFISNTKFNNSQFLHLKTVLNGGKYYLIGCLSNTKVTPKKFFDSFKITNFKIPAEKFEVRKDTSLHFTVNTTIKPPLDLNYFWNNRKKKKDYMPKKRSLVYKSDLNEDVRVTFNKYHDYESYANVDSLWNNLTKQYTSTSVFNHLNSVNVASINPDYLLNNTSNKKKKFILSNKTTGKDKNGFEQLNFLLKNKESSKAIKVKYVLKNGVVYKLESLIDTAQTHSKFIDEFYNSFKPNDSVFGKSLLTSKTDLFFEALKNKDSLVYDSYQTIDFNESNTDELIDIISNFKFDESQQKVKTSLLKQLSYLKNPKVKPFLENLYKNSYDNPYNQIAIINSFANKNTSEANKKLLKLLEYDFPLTSKAFEISSMLRPLNDSLEISKQLFPSLLNFTTINEYKEPIYDLLAALTKKKLINPKVYKSYKNQILTEAKIELKRQLSKKIENNSFKKGSYRSYNNYSMDNSLNSYTQLLFPFRKDKNIAEFLTKLETTDNYFVKILFIILKIEAKESFNTEMFNELASNIKSRSILYKELKEIKKEHLFPSKFKNQQAIATSVLFKNYRDIEKNKDSLEFLEKRTFKISEKNYNIYFYKTKQNNSFNNYNKGWKLNFIAFEIPKNNKIETKYFHKKTGQEIDETKELSELLDNFVEATRLKNRKRVNLKQENNFNSYY